MIYYIAKDKYCGSRAWLHTKEPEWSSPYWLIAKGAFDHHVLLIDQDLQIREAKQNRW